jgi:DnaJ family protein A protein 2
MKNNSKIRFSGESDERPGIVPGDVIILIQEKEHDRFKRKGADLLYTCEISLSESLCGFTKTITHLDGRVIKVTVPAGQVIKHQQLKVIQGEGMPHLGNPFTKGRLYILFNVVFPKTLPAETVALLKKSLPRPPETQLTGEEEDCHMTDGDINHMGQGDEGNGGREVYGDDDDEDGRGQRVQCGQA